MVSHELHRESFPVFRNLNEESHQLVLSIVAYSRIGCGDVHAVWEKVGERLPSLGEADFAVAVAELAASNLVRIDRGCTLVITDAGRRTLGI
jgi:hypothetical protein